MSTTRRALLLLDDGTHKPDVRKSGTHKEKPHVHRTEPA